MTQTDGRAEMIAKKAAVLCGVPFRLHGRDQVLGLDCIGLVQACLEHAGLPSDPPNGYSVQAGSLAKISAFLADIGFASLDRDEALRPGDIALVQPGPLQWHLMVRAEGGFAHAHAGIGRVVFLSGPSPWPVRAVFRLQEE